MDEGIAEDRSPSPKDGAALGSVDGVSLKRRMFSVMAASVGSRSMPEAPKKPTTPSVLART